MHSSRWAPGSYLFIKQSIWLSVALAVAVKIFGSLKHPRTFAFLPPLNLNKIQANSLKRKGHEGFWSANSVTAGQYDVYNIDIMINYGSIVIQIKKF